LVAIPSVSAASGDPAQVRASAEAVAAMFADLGLDTEILQAQRPDGSPGAPAVVATRPAPPGRPTVMLYAHHDVQPTGDPAGWTSAPFEPTERDGRLYGRGTADDKAGVMVHVSALRTLLPRWGDEDGVGLVVFVEGEEEAGSPSFADFLQRHHQRLACDVIVVADSDNWTVHDPSLTVSLRGLVEGTLEVATLATGLHSGMFGGAAPDALMVLCTVLARLWDGDGQVAVPGLVSARAADVDYDEALLARQAGLLDGVRPVGTGTVPDRLWAKPALTVTGIDAPSVEAASNTLVPRARAKVTLRIAPGQDPAAAAGALTEFLQADPPFGAQVRFAVGDLGQAFAADLDGEVYDIARWALSQAWDGATVVEQGIGGSIPFIAELLTAFPQAVVVITGVEDPQTFAHGTDESLDLGVFHRAALAEVLMLAGLAAT
jgi:acetylornithine deacetylase/succinyl-diaminopimelate desuccinylase-like protein